MHPESDVVLISALEHWSYCPRQCGLIHVEQVYDENVVTLRVSRAHQRVDEALSTVENGKRVERALPVWSDALGLYGIADVVEFHADGAVFPIEYKHGPRKANRHDDLQLCAQALCLEEMLGVPVPRGAVYSIQSKRRRDVAFSAKLREETRRAVEDVRAMLKSGVLPPPVSDARCPPCSLVDACVPATLVAASLRPLEPSSNDDQ
jgi:CRISPR-associated exonuclease Cas4